MLIQGTAPLRASLASQCAGRIVQLAVAPAFDAGRLVALLTTGQDDIIGAYTPVTKNLWLERLKWSNSALQTSQIQKELVPKPPQQHTVKYPFSKDTALREQYRNPWNLMRLGRLLEDLDSLAGNVAFDHCFAPGARPPLLVTASVDAITLSAPVSCQEDVDIRGRVVWTGRSSLDIQMDLFQGNGTSSSVSALFSFVSLDPVSKAPLAVNPLVPNDDDSLALFEKRQIIADQRRALRKQRSDTGVRPVSGTAAVLRQEGQLAADMPALAPHDALPQAATSLSNIFVCQPQQRNMHGRVFGGFLMRRAYELAFATAYMFAGSRPAFLHVSDITFQRPVDVGDLLRLRSWVVHTRPPGSVAGTDKGHIHVEVIASVAQPERVDSHVTNTFRFTYAVDPPLDRPLRRVLPLSEEETARLVACLEDLAQG